MEEFRTSMGRIPADCEQTRFTFYYRASLAMYYSMEPSICLNVLLRTAGDSLMRSQVGKIQSHAMIDHVSCWYGKLSRGESEEKNFLILSFPEGLN